MPLKRNRRKRRNIVRAEQPSDLTDMFVIKKTATYLYRHLAAFPCTELDEEFFDLLSFGMNESLEGIIERSLNRFESPRKDQYLPIVQKCLDSNSRFNDIIPCILERAPNAFCVAIRQSILEALKNSIEKHKYRCKSDLEKNLYRIKKTFKLNKAEVEFALFLYIIFCNSKLDTFFIDELHCQRLSGKKYLANVLELTRGELDQVMNGTLKKIDFFSFDMEGLVVESEFVNIFEYGTLSDPSRLYFNKIKRPAIPLDYHLTVQKVIPHIISLFKKKPVSSTHILLYGAPGTGKTSFAEGLAKELKIPAYTITKDADNKTKRARLAIMACLNITNSGDGSLVVVDEADNLLNTRFSWFSRGETQDKGWLNKLMEEPGVRMIWITNEIDDIAPSVLRRFSYSLHFKPFNKRQRVLLWENILRYNRVKRFFTSDEVNSLAVRYRVNAGVIDLAVKKAKETGITSKPDYQNALRLALDAYLALENGGEKEIDRERIEETYSLEGLNIKGDLKGALGQLEAFDQFLRKADDDRVLTINLLLYGPPGTGKSEFARYLGRHLDREIIVKRISDLQSKWVGDSEKNIRDAFYEAEREEAILIMDEADSLVFSRDYALHSWEISFTNEFLARLERFKGILICTTNRLKDLDQASIRRFQHKLGFDYLDAEGNLIFYQKLLEGLVDEPLDDENIAKLKDIRNLAPGDFKTVRDRFIFISDDGLNHQTLVEALRNESEIKKVFLKTGSIGF